jgi:hypothetical protein
VRKNKLNAETFLEGTFTQGTIDRDYSRSETSMTFTLLVSLYWFYNKKCKCKKKKPQNSNTMCITDLNKTRTKNNAFLEDTVHFFI